MLLLVAAASPAYAKTERPPVNQAQHAQYEKQFDTALFSKCNICHKPLASTVVANRTIPSYATMSGMRPDAIKNGIEHGGHISSADKDRIYAALHPAAESGQRPKIAAHQVTKKATKISAKKTTKKIHKPGKHGRSKKRK